MVNVLFTLTTPTTRLIWQQMSVPPALQGATPVGQICLMPQQERQLTLDPLPEGLRVTPLNTPLPAAPLFEQTTYRLSLRAEPHQTIVIRHRDPDIQKCFAPLDPSQPHWLMGEFNFRSQVGLTDFEIWLNEVPAYTLQLEVFPIKLAYKEDFQQMLAEVQEILSGLAFQYLASTYQGGQMAAEPSSTELEWILVFEHILTDLEKAVQQIAQQPIRGLQRQRHWQPIGRIRHVTSALRQAIRRGQGRGERITLHSHLSVHSQMPASQAGYTLDTPEHRWLATQIQRLRQKVAQLKATEQARHYVQPEHVLRLEAFEHRLAHLQQLEPLAAASYHAIPGFSSLQLMGTSGYREAYRAILTLELGLRLEGNALNVSLKDLATLYEYWCYLALVRLLSELCQGPPDWQNLIAVQQGGLQVRLQQGQPSMARFRLGDTRIDLRYNPQLEQNALLPHRPDVLLEVARPNAPVVRAVLDAKYRLDMSASTCQYHGIPAPPDDALNVLHRYRDAILYEETLLPENEPPTLARSVIQGVALYPYTVQSASEYPQSRLFKSLLQLGVGAIPCVPTQTEHLREWLQVLLTGQPWQWAHTSFPAVLQPALRQAASEGVLVGTLRGSDPAGHWTWLQQQMCYYIPYQKSPHGRPWRVQWVALYLPKRLRSQGVGAVCWVGQVEQLQVVARSSLQTPWHPRLEGPVVLYQVKNWQPLRPIANLCAERVNNRWTTRLALECAQHLGELSLETVPEWQLYEALQRERYLFNIKAAKVPRLQDESIGHACFELALGGMITYAGAAGFVWQGQTYASLTKLMRALTATVS